MAINSYIDDGASEIFEYVRNRLKQGPCDNLTLSKELDLDAEFLSRLLWNSSCKEMIDFDPSRSGDGNIMWELFVSDEVETPSAPAEPDHWKNITWKGQTRSPGYCFVEFKVDTPYFGCLPIDSFRRTMAACDEIQRAGKIQWEGRWYPILQDRTADLRQLSGEYSRPLITFVTDQLHPLTE